MTPRVVVTNVEPECFGKAQVRLHRIAGLDGRDDLFLVPFNTRWEWMLPIGDRVLVGHRQTWREAMDMVDTARQLVADGAL